MLGLGSKGFLRAGLVTLLVVAGLAQLAPSLIAQQAPTPAEPPSTPESGYMRVLLRPTHPPVFDAQHRPITAGGFVEGAPVVLEDVTCRRPTNRLASPRDQPVVEQAPHLLLQPVDIDRKSVV